MKLKRGVIYRHRRSQKSFMLTKAQAGLVEIVDAERAPLHHHTSGVDKTFLEKVNTMDEKETE